MNLLCIVDFLPKSNPYLNIIQLACVYSKIYQIPNVYTLKFRDDPDFMDEVMGYNPSAIVIFGDHISEKLIPNYQKTHRGWVYRLNGIPTLPTLPAVEPLFYREGDRIENVSAINRANLVGYVARQISTLLCGKRLFDASNVKPNVRLVDSMTRFNKLLALLDKAPAIAVDVETEHLSYHNNRILVIQFAVDENYGYVLPYRHKDSPFTVQELYTIKDKLHAFFSQEVSDRYLIGHNIKYDLKMIRKEFGVQFIHWPVWDTIAGEWCLDENIRTLKEYGTPAWGLDQMLASYGNDYYYKAEFSKGERFLLSHTDLTKALDYCAMDVQSVYKIHQLQIARADHIGYKQYKNFVLNQMGSMIHTMSIMEERGVLVDIQYLMNLKANTGSFNQELESIKQQFNQLEEVKRCSQEICSTNQLPITGLFGNETYFNIDKPDHIRKLFFETLGLKPLKKGKSGNGSIDKAFQEAYKDNPIVALYSEYQQLKTIKNSFINSLWDKVTHQADCLVDHRIRPSFGFQDILTGRSNSFDPNLQQIPARKKLAKIIKRIFIAPQNHLLIKLDYNAHEVRCWGIISRDENLAKVFNKSNELEAQYRKSPSPELRTKIKTIGDFHRQNYSFFTGIPVDQVTDEQRQVSKSITFGVIYGKSPESLANDLQKPIEEVHDLLNRFFSLYDKAYHWLEWAKSFSRKNLYVYSPLGRRRNLFGYILNINKLSSALERRAMNSPIQGMASDFGFLSARIFMTEMYKTLKQFGFTDLPVGINVMIHDSIEVETSYECFPIALHLLEWSTTKGVKEYVRRVFNYPFVMDLKVEMEIGASADNMQKWDFTIKGLIPILQESFKFQQELYGQAGSVALIKQYWQKYKPWLNQQYPLE